MKTLLSFYILFITSTSCFSQAHDFIKLTQKIEITQKQKKVFGYVKTMIPASIPNKQTIVNLTYSMKPSKIIEEEGFTFAVWDVTKLKTGKFIEVNCTLIVNELDLHTIKLHKGKIEPDLEIEKYLESYAFKLDEDEEVNAKARGLLGENEEETVKNIMTHVLSQTAYYHSLETYKNEQINISLNKDYHTDNLNLMHALCLENNLPARIASGLLLDPDFGAVKHNWIEIYLSKLGWVPFDPSSATEQNAHEKYSMLEGQYVYYSNRTNTRQVNWDYSSIGSQTPFEYRVNYAFVNSLQPNFETAMILYRNYDNRTALSVFNRLLNRNSFNYRYHIYVGILYARIGDYKTGLKYLQDARIEDTKRPFLGVNQYYVFANFYALNGEHELALNFLEQAVNARHVSPSMVLDDKDFTAIQDLPRFKKILNIN